MSLRVHQLHARVLQSHVCDTHHATDRHRHDLAFNYCCCCSTRRGSQVANHAVVSQPCCLLLPTLQHAAIGRQCVDATYWQSNQIRAADGRQPTVQSVQLERELAAQWRQRVDGRASPHDRLVGLVARQLASLAQVGRHVATRQRLAVAFVACLVGLVLAGLVFIVVGHIVNVVESLQAQESTLTVLPERVAERGASQEEQRYSNTHRARHHRHSIASNSNHCNQPAQDQLSQHSRLDQLIKLNLNRFVRFIRFFSFFLPFVFVCLFV